MKKEDCSFYLYINMIKLILNQTPLIKLSGRLIKVFVDEYITEVSIASHQQYLSLSFQFRDGDRRKPRL